MTDPAPGGTAQAVRLLLAQLEASTARTHELRRQLRAEELNRRRLAAAADPAISTLDGEQAERLRRRLYGAVHAEALVGARSARTRLQAILEYLAANSGAVIKVAEVTTHLARQGFRDVPAGYASDTLKRFERNGIVARVRFARYRVNDVHPEIASLELRSLEAEAGLRPPRAPTRARDERPRFAPERDDEEDEDLTAEIAALKAQIEAHPMRRRREGE